MGYYYGRIIKEIDDKIKGINTEGPSPLDDPLYVFRSIRIIMRHDIEAIRTGDGKDEIDVEAIARKLGNLPPKEKKQENGEKPNDKKAEKEETKTEKESKKDEKKPEREEKQGGRKRSPSNDISSYDKTTGKAVKTK